MCVDAGGWVGTDGRAKIPASPRGEWMQERTATQDTVMDHSAQEGRRRTGAGPCSRHTRQRGPLSDPCAQESFLFRACGWSPEEQHTRRLHHCCRCRCYRCGHCLFLHLNSFRWSYFCSPNAWMQGLFSLDDLMSKSNRILAVGLAKEAGVRRELEPPE